MAVFCSILPTVKALYLLIVSNKNFGEIRALARSLERLGKTALPTTSPTSFDRLTAIKDILWPISGDALGDLTYYQYQALSWLAFEDVQQLSLEEDVDARIELLERYVVVVLYYSTNGPNWL